MHGTLVLKNLWAVMKFNIKKNYTKIYISFIVIFLGLGRYYLGPFAFISYLIAAIFAKYKLKLVEWLLILVLFFTAIVSFFLYGLSNVLNLYIFHWGFIFYFLFF